MDINSVSASATSLITGAQQKASSAAQTIASIPVQKNEVGGTKAVTASDPFKPVLSLKEAEFENAAGVKLLQAEKSGIGSLFDAIA